MAPRLCAWSYTIWHGNQRLRIGGGWEKGSLTRTRVSLIGPTSKVSHHLHLLGLIRLRALYVTCGCTLLGPVNGKFENGNQYIGGFLASPHGWRRDEKTSPPRRLPNSRSRFTLMHPWQPVMSQLLSLSSIIFNLTCSMTITSTLR